MAEALDAFVIDGVSHNIPFLSAVMGHERWREGRLSTAFIDEEFAGGFVPVEPGADDRWLFACVALSMELVRRDRLEQRPAGRAEAAAGPDRWVVMLDRDQVDIALAGRPDIEAGIFEAGFDDLEEAVRVASDWAPGQAIWRGTVGERAVQVQVRPFLNGAVLSRAGLSVSTRILSRRLAELDALMPASEAADSTKMMLCPMPGQVVTIQVEVDEEVKAGDPLVIVEAMKMQNVLRAERDGKVKEIFVSPGDSLAVEAPIMAFH